jgi:hypothetical protein
LRDHDWYCSLAGRATAHVQSLARVGWPGWALKSGIIGSSGRRWDVCVWRPARMPLVKTEPTAYEGSYECAICWDSCRGDKEILGCVRCPGVRKMHVKCYEGWLAAGKRKGCTQCNGPISAYVPESAEACVIVIESDEEPATMEPVSKKLQAKTAAGLSEPLETGPNARCSAFGLRSDADMLEGIYIYSSAQQWQSLA